MASCNTDPQQHSTLQLLIGTYTGSGSEGIYQVSFETSTGSLSGLQLIASTSNPSYLAVSEDGSNVYSVGEDESGTLSSWQWSTDGQLQLINQVSSYGVHPCYIDVQKGLLAVANYSSGNGGVFQLSTNGGLKKAFSEFQHHGSGANMERQESPHAHFSQFSADGRFLYVIDLGIDQVLAYPMTEGKLGVAVTALSLEPGDGPRHLEFHPNKNQVFIVNELSNTVVSAAVDPVTGTFSVIDRLSTLPEEFTDHSQCADIHLSNDGKFLYASNRGHQSIAMYQVADSGELAFLGTEATRGDWPRNFLISPDDQFLLVANQESDNIVVFSRDKVSGLLEYTGTKIELSKPVCLKVIPEVKPVE